MKSKFMVGLAVVCAMACCESRAANFEVTGSSHSHVTDLLANPNAADDDHGFDNTTGASVVMPTTIGSTAAMTLGSSSGSVTASEGIFEGLSTATYGNTGLNEYATTDVRANASDLMTITSATLPANTPVTINFTLSVNGTLTSPEVSAGGNYESFATAQFSILQSPGGATSLMLKYDSEPGSQNSLSGPFSGFVGEQLILGQSMELTTYVGDSYQFAHPGTATVDFSHTVQFFADSVTGGILLVSSSGHNFAAPLPGDFNHDGRVNALDYVVWRDNNGPQSDYDLWRAHFGESIVGSGAGVAPGVPEPGSLALIGIVSVCASFSIRRRSRATILESPVRLQPRVG